MPSTTRLSAALFDVGPLKQCSGSPPGLVNIPASYTVSQLTSTVSSSLSTSRCLGQIPTTTGGYQILPFRLPIVTARSGMLKLRCALAEIIICILFWYLGARAQGCRQGCDRVRCRNAPRFVIRMQTNTSKTSIFLSVPLSGGSWPIP